MIALPDTPAEPSALEKYLETLKELKRRKDENKLADYKPYPRQLDFHAAGAKFRERLFMAGNQGHPHHFKIKTPHGDKQIGDLTTNDYAITPDGTATKITGIVPLGMQRIYLVSFNGQDKFVECSAEHTWHVTDTYGKESECTTLELSAGLITPSSHHSQNGDVIDFVYDTGVSLESSCIVIEDALGLYVCANGIVTHNCGKTWSSAYEIAYHLTGQYPDDWKGRRWTRPVTGWASGVTSESLRDTLQRLVMGRPEEWGTGTLPKDCIIKVSRAMGIADAIDTVHVKHVTGGISRLAFKSYEKGREKWQGETVDFVAYDEEPPLDIYIEGLTRTNATGGIVWMTFTPLLGMSKVVKRFLQEHNDDRNITRMTIHDVGHYTEEERNRIVSSYPEHEREARAAGKPVLGDGAVFPVAESTIKVPAFHLPDLWPRICAIDFGWAHKTAINWLAWDRDTDTVYVYDVVAVSKQTPAQIAPMIKQRGEWIPCAWPHDGLQTEKGSGIQLAEQYRTAGINMLYEMAQLPETGVEGEQKVSRTSVEAGISLMLQAMQQGRFKVFDHLNDWFDEFGNYHRKDGKIVAEGDDIMSSCRYAFVSLRHAIVPPDPTKDLYLKRDYDWRV